MLTSPRRISTFLAICICFASVFVAAAPAADAPPAKAIPPSGPIDQGLRVFTCAHSFHNFVPKLLAEIAESAKIKDHVIVGVSSIGGSHAFQHFNVPDDKNKAKPALIAGGVDVMTLSCMERPDEGISSFAKLGFEHNPNFRLTIQELWVPEDHWPFDPPHRLHKKTPLDFNETKIEDLKKTNEEYEKVMNDYVTALNATLGKQVVFVVPDVEAARALREKILAGAAPGLTKASDLFTDGWGHASPPLRLMSAYCHFAVVYRRSPVGLPIPKSAGIKDEALNHLLQELAWDAVTQCPLSGVRGDK